ncbi:SCO family protein [Pollutimonas harenae]|uniref:SCO family protein n=1 Tax=Pollutimonas harenae TaxID=657015 RepID=A0A853H6Y5_9BURK|nr:SCO family protein [Pollutimonas harenae]NYT86905.1 SCO family protein [Pollutimonas harenae]TEA69381.1 SCO family protein [Pollutimonas harenae]
MRMLLMVLLVACVGTGSIYYQTNGFTVLTTEEARRADVLRHPRSLPDAVLQTADGRAITLRQGLRGDGRVAVVNFMYTRCFSICLAMGSELQQLQASIARSGMGDKVYLLSISFDPGDTPAQLTRYAQSMGADPALWQFAVMPNATQRTAVLKAFGITVVPAPMKQFVHNAAYHLVSPDGRLQRIVDLGSAGLLLDYVAEISQ